MRTRRPQIPRGWLSMSMEQQSAACRAEFKGEIPGGLTMRNGTFWTWDEIHKEEQRVMWQFDCSLPRSKERIRKMGY